MNYDLLVKSFIAFCIGAIVYKFILDRCSCGIVEGQNNNASTAQPEIDPGVATQQKQMFSVQPELTPPLPNMEPVTLLSKQSLSNIPIENVKEFINNINDNVFKKPIKDNIDKLRLALSTTDKSVPDLPEVINTISSFEQFGEVPDALDYLELIVMNISNLDNKNFELFIGSIMNSADTEYCSIDEDLNAYIISIILLQYYNIKIVSEQKYINISNKLSKHIPTILEKIQSLNETCDDSNKKIKSNIMDTMIYRLFKNNNTVINIGSLDSLVNELNKLDRVYGVVILLCITYIVVKFLGMFNMKMEV